MAPKTTKIKPLPAFRGLVSEGSTTANPMLPEYKNFDNRYDFQPTQSPTDMASNYMNNGNNVFGMGSYGNQGYTPGMHTGAGSTMSASQAMQGLGGKTDSQLFNNGKSYTLSGGRVNKPFETTTPMFGGAPDLYTGSDFSKLSEQQQLDFARAGGTIGDTGNMIPGQGGMFDGISAGGIAQGIGAAANLANAYLGYKNYGLAKDKFGFEKAATNRSIANQASEYNTGIQNAGEVGMGLAGNTMDVNARMARQAQLDAQKISGAPIG